MDKQILKSFYDLNSPAAYSSIHGIKKEFKNVRTDKIRRILAKELPYSLFKPRRYKFPKLLTVPYGFLEEFHADLADMQKLKWHNKGFRYILVAVCPMSRQMFAVPTKSKSSKDMKTAFDELFKKTKPAVLLTDKGGEFMAKEMMGYFKKNGIEHHHPETDGSKASFAEERIGVLKRRLYKYFEAKNTKNWINVLDKFCTSINNSYCRSIKTTPNSVNSKNWYNLWKKLYGSRVNPIDKTYYKIGDFVRLRWKKKVFDRSYKPTFTDEVFEIVKINDSIPKTIEVVDCNKEPIIGKFYKEELSLTDKDTLYRIEKVIKKRIKDGEEERLVKFISYPGTFWIKL